MRPLTAVDQAPMVVCTMRGQLGEALTKEPMSVRAWTTAEALGMIRCNFPQFEAVLEKATEDGIQYQVCANGFELDFESLANPISGEQRSIIITPVPAGEGGNFGTVLAGTALIVGSFFSGGTLASVLLSSGLAVAGGGVANILSPQPATPATEEERRQSALFDGNSGAAEDGDAVYLHYGLTYASGKILSYSTLVEDV